MALPCTSKLVGHNNRVLACQAQCIVLAEAASYHGYNLQPQYVVIIFTCLQSI